MRRIARLRSRDSLIALIIAAGVTFSICVHTFARHRSVREAFLSEDVVRVWIPSRHRAAATMRSAELEVVRETGLFRGVAAYLTAVVEIEVNGTAWESPSALVNPAFWKVFDLRAVRGRLFDERDSMSASEIAVISSDLWKIRFGNDPRAVGSVIRVSGRPVTIVGVAPDGFAYPGRRTSLWMVLPNVPPSGTALQHPVVARTHGDSSAAAASAALRSALKEHLEGLEAVRVQPVHEFELASVRPYLILLQFLAFLFVVLVLGNVICLLWLSQVDQIRTTAIKMALGASPSRLIGFELRRVVATATGAGALSVAGVYSVLKGIEALRPDWPVRLPGTFADGTALILAFLSAVVLAGASSGCSSLLVLRRVHAGATRERLGQPWSRRTQRSMLLLQLVVPFGIVPAGLLHGSYLLAMADGGRHLLNRDIVALKVKLPSDKYAENTTQIATLRALFDDLAAKGVRQAAITNALPLAGSRTLRTVKAHSRPYDEESMSTVDLRIVSPSLLPILSAGPADGRFLRESDVFGSTPSVVVDGLLTRQVFGEDVQPGHQITLGQRPWEIVGIVEPVRESLAAELQPTVWLSYQQLEYLQMSDDYLATFWLVFRAEDASTVADVKAAIRDVAPAAVSGDGASLASLAYAEVADRVGYASIAILSGALTLLLSIAGLYAVTAARVRMMERELATRAAIGAATNHLVWICMRDVAFALPLAIALGWAANQALAGLIPLAVPAGAISLSRAMLLASGVVSIGLIVAVWKPIRIGRRVSPLIALRSDP